MGNSITTGWNVLCVWLFEGLPVWEARKKAPNKCPVHPKAPRWRCSYKSHLWLERTNHSKMNSSCKHQYSLLKLFFLYLLNNLVFDLQISFPIELHLSNIMHFYWQFFKTVKHEVLVVFTETWFHGIFSPHMSHHPRKFSRFVQNPTNIKKSKMGPF